MQERRGSKRVPIALFVRFEIEDQEEAKYGSFTQDASVDGLKLLSPYKLKTNANLNMSIDIPNDPDMAQAEGNVRWVSQKPIKDETGNELYPAGVAFTYMDRQDKTFFEKYLNQ